MFISSTNTIDSISNESSNITQYQCTLLLRRLITSVDLLCFGATVEFNDTVIFSHKNKPIEPNS